MQDGISKLGLLAMFAPIAVRHKISAGGLSVGVGPHGELKVDTPEESCILETTAGIATTSTWKPRCTPLSVTETARPHCTGDVSER